MGEVKEVIKLDELSKNACHGHITDKCKKEPNCQCGLHTYGCVQGGCAKDTYGMKRFVSPWRPGA